MLHNNTTPRLRVLIIEDDPLNVENLQYCVLMTGHSVAGVLAGATGLRGGVLLGLDRLRQQIAIDCRAFDCALVDGYLLEGSLMGEEIVPLLTARGVACIGVSSCSAKNRKIEAAGAVTSVEKRMAMEEVVLRQLLAVAARALHDRTS